MNDPQKPSKSYMTDSPTANIAAEMISKFGGNQPRLDPDTIRNSRSLQHASAVSVGLPETPRHREDGTLEMPSDEELSRTDANGGNAFDRATARDRIAHRMERAGVIKPGSYDRDLTNFAVDLNRERALNENDPGDSGSVLSRDQIIRALSDAVMSRRRGE